MKSVERQIVAGLDQLHRELAGGDACRWFYDGRGDVYSCAHLTLNGKVVIDRVQEFNWFVKGEEHETATTV